MGKIGVFDSGFGGLTILAELRKRLPEYSYTYLGDNARAPYGPRPQEEILQFTSEAVDYLMSEEDCELVILACNTASAEALRKIQQEYLPANYPDRRVLGVIIPTIERLAEDGAGTSVGVIATQGTVLSGAYPKELRKVLPEIHVYQSAAPELVPAIEAGLLGERVGELIREYTKPLCQEGVESLILGCTHYAIIEEQFAKILPDGIRIYNQSGIVAEKFEDYLFRHPEIEKRLAKNGGVKYLCTTKPDIFAGLAENLLGIKVRASKISLDRRGIKCS